MGKRIMNCCDHNHDNTNNTTHKPKKHMPHWVHMILCCGIPIILLLLFPYISKLIPGAAALGFLIPLICPLMMGLMMFNMFKNNKEKSKNDAHCETNK